jgi:hypothetical protein
VEPDASLNFPLLQGWHSVAPLVLDLPTVQFSHDSLGGSLPLVPAAHALKPLGLDASILDPSGTTTEEEPPRATTCPGSTLLQIDCSGFGCKYPEGHGLHFTLPFVLENLPGGQEMHDTELALLVYNPGSQAVLFAVFPLQ